MQNWLRALLALALPFVVVVAVTFGLAELIVGGAAGSGGVQGTPSATDSAPSAPTDGPMTAVGGTLSISGDREGVLVLDREATDQGYALTGEEGRIAFGGDPLVVERVSYDGLEFYVDKGDCALTPGQRHDPTGVAGAAISCEAIEDIRGGGSISVEGTVGVSADLLGLRGDLPPHGGTITVGEDELEFPYAVLYAMPNFSAPGGGFLATDDGSALARFEYDPHTHALTLVAIQLDRSVTEIAPGACSIDAREIGLLNPRTTTMELTLDCPAVELASGESVPIRGSLIVDLTEPA